MINGQLQCPNVRQDMLAQPYEWWEGIARDAVIDPKTGAIGVSGFHSAEWKEGRKKGDVTLLDGKLSTCECVFKKGPRKGGSK